MAARIGSRRMSSASASRSRSRRGQVVLPVHPRRQPEEELLVAILAPGELSVEPPEIGIGECPGEQREPLAAPGLDDRCHQQPIQLPLRGGGPHQRLERLGVRVPGIAAQREPSPLEELEHPGEMPALLACEPGHVGRESRDVGVRLEQRQGVRRRLLLAVGVIHEHRVEVRERVRQPPWPGLTAEGHAVAIVGRR